LSVVFSRESALDLVIIPLLIISVVGVFYLGTYPDFCIVNGKDICANPANWVNGVPTQWQGCQSTCTLSPLTFFQGTIFSFLINGDFIGFVKAFFNPSAQTAISVLSLVAGVVLLIIGLGVGFAAQALATGASFQVNDQGTKLAQSFGINLIIWGAIFGFFGGWVNTLGFGFAVLTSVFLTTIFSYGAWQQARSQFG